MDIFVIFNIVLFIIVILNFSILYIAIFNYDVILLVQVDVTYKYDDNFIAIGEGRMLWHNETRL